MRRDIEFTSGGETVRGWLYTPDGGTGPFPVVVMAGGWCYVKEIVLPHYAEAILKSGVAVLMFDYRGLGESEGEPRQHIDPWAQIEDYKNAISFVAKQPEVDARRIGIWGISYAGGHVIAVAASDPRVKCAVSTVPVVEGWETMKRCHGERKFEKLLNLNINDFSKIGADTAQQLADPELRREEMRDLMKSIAYPEGWFYVERAVVIMFGLASQLAPKLNTVHVGFPYIMKFLADRTAARAAAAAAPAAPAPTAAASPS